MTTPLHNQLLAALSTALPNTWAVELPPNPEWPAAVFDVDSKPEEGWCMGGGYVRHQVSVVVLSRNLADLVTLLPTEGGGPLRTALQALPAYQFEEGCADADYEPDPAVYGRSLTVNLRTPVHPA